MTANEFIKFEYDIINSNYIICNEKKYVCKLLNANEYLNIDWKINNNAKVSSSKELNVIVNDDIYTSSLLIYSHSNLDNNSFSRYSIYLFRNNTLISISNFKLK